MADEKTKTPKDRTVEERLKDLYLLQTILSEMDRIKILRGELPNEVKDLEDEIAMYQTRIQKFQNEVADMKKKASKLQAEILDRSAKIEKYRDQQNNVRNSREFDFLEKEIEFEGLEIELAKKKIREKENEQRQKAEDIAKTKEQLSDSEHILVDKRKELDEIVSETRQQVEDLQAKAKTIEPLIDERTLKAFKRIRKNVRNGLGIVAVERSACGGCFNKIPPQRQLDIRSRKKIIVCEYCGRIMIDPELAGIAPEVKEEPVKEKTTRSRKKAADAE